MESPWARFGAALDWTDVVDEVVDELYGGWTVEARRMVAQVDVR